MTTEATRLGAMNQALAALPPTLSDKYDILLGVASRKYHLTVVDGRMRVTPANAADSGALSLALDSVSSLRRLSAEGRAAAMPMLAAGKLKLTGDHTLIEDLQRELEPMAAQLAAPARALAFGDEAEPVRWVPDRDAYQCMRCAAPFTLTRRRHHCRVCGDVCCSRCAPSAPSGQVRTCTQCDPRSRPASSVEPPPATSDRSPAAPTANGAADGAPEPLGAAECLMEYHIEASLARVWHLSCAAAAGSAYVAFTAALRAYAAARLAFPPDAFPLGWALGHVVMASGACAVLALRRVVLRYVTVWWTTMVVALHVLWAHMRSRGRSEAAQRVAWELTHRVNARFVFDRVVELGGGDVRSLAPHNGTRACCFHDGTRDPPMAFDWLRAWRRRSAAR